MKVDKFKHKIDHNTACNRDKMYNVSQKNPPPAVFWHFSEMVGNF